MKRCLVPVIAIVLAIMFSACSKPGAWIDQKSPLTDVDNVITDIDSVTDSIEPADDSVVNDPDIATDTEPNVDEDAVIDTDIATDDIWPVDIEPDEDIVTDDFVPVDEDTVVDTDIVTDDAEPVDDSVIDTDTSVDDFVPVDDSVVDDDVIVDTDNATDDIGPADDDAVVDTDTADDIFPADFDDVVDDDTATDDVVPVDDSVIDTDTATDDIFPLDFDFVVNDDDTLITDEIVADDDTVADDSVTPDEDTVDDTITDDIVTDDIPADTLVTDDDNVVPDDDSIPAGEEGGFCKTDNVCDGWAAPGTLLLCKILDNVCYTLDEGALYTDFVTWDGPISEDPGFERSCESYTDAQYTYYSGEYEPWKEDNHYLCDSYPENSPTEYSLSRGLCSVIPAYRPVPDFIADIIAIQKAHPEQDLLQLGICEEQTGYYSIPETDPLPPDDDTLPDDDTIVTDDIVTDDIATDEIVADDDTTVTDNTVTDDVLPDDIVTDDIVPDDTPIDDAVTDDAVVDEDTSATDDDITTDTTVPDEFMVDNIVTDDAVDYEPILDEDNIVPDDIITDNATNDDNDDFVTDDVATDDMVVDDFIPDNEVPDSDVPTDPYAGTEGYSCRTAVPVCNAGLYCAYDQNAICLVQPAGIAPIGEEDGPCQEGLSCDGTPLLFGTTLQCGILDNLCHAYADTVLQNDVITWDGPIPRYLRSCEQYTTALITYWSHPYEGLRSDGLYVCDSYPSTAPVEYSTSRGSCIVTSAYQPVADYLQAIRDLQTAHPTQSLSDLGVCEPGVTGFYINPVPTP